MGKTKKLRFFTYILEFKLKKKENKEKLRILTSMLLNELEGQGYDISGSTDTCNAYVTIMEFGQEINIGVNQCEYIVLGCREG